MTTAKLFNNGASQAVRLPREFRFEGSEVLIKRLGRAVILVPADEAWSMFVDVCGQADEDFVRPPQQSQPVERRKRLD